ncbi:MAG TPA: hypothetical protein ENO02_04770 [Epsilonproteobacteria bacterium]|nr:hypothetical protein [Campylobacterota bacterium]
MNKLKLILIGLFLIILNSEMAASNTFTNDMTVLNEGKDSDIAEIEIKGNGEYCRLSLESNGNIYNSSCKSLVNSKGVTIYCTQSKKLCKTYDEIYEFIFNPRPETITFQGIVSDSSLESIEGDGVAIWFSPDSEAAKKIFDSCASGEICEVTGVVNDGYLVSVNSVKKDTKTIEVKKNQTDIPASSNITWADLGIGLENPGEITDWTYYGIKTATEASRWIEILEKFFGKNISYSAVARLWKMDGFSAQEAGKWIEIGIKDHSDAKDWAQAGIENPQEVLEWKNIGVETPYQYADWKPYVDTVSEAKELKSIGISSPSEITFWKQFAGVETIDEIRQWSVVGIRKYDQVSEWKNIGINTPQAAKEWVDAGFNTPHEVGSWMKVGLSTAGEVQEWKSAGASDAHTYSRLQAKSLALEEVKKIQSEGKSVQDYSYDPAYYEDSHISAVAQAMVYGFFGLIVITMFMGVGENRKIVIFQDYDDVGLTFLIPVSFVLIMMIAPSVGGEPKYAGIFALIVSGGLFLLLIRNTYMYNNGSIPYTIMALITKIPLGLLWVWLLIGVTNPSGKTAENRRKNRAQALLLFTLITPLILLFIADKTGNRFNPKDWLRYKRVGSIKNHL